MSNRLWYRCQIVAPVNAALAAIPRGVVGPVFRETS
jgi:hypothetical protein